ncbi:hypothetical protein ACKFRT_01835 [Corynebacterium sp. YSMAA1_1_F7]|uniref:hypothetical protein n=1 Tax=Corynebacterium sp. YSMAA1_1_F7 TaxID=3383590 RepID=UPI0038CF2F0A
MPTTPIPNFVAQLLYHPDLSPDSQDNLVLTCLVTWAVEEQGYELETEYVLDWDIINAYADSLISAYAPGTAQRRRSRLRTMTRIVNPSYVEPHALDPVEPDSTPQLYTPAEIEQIEVWMNYAANAATNVMNKQLVVFLCLGASLRAKEASYLTWEQVYVDETGVMLLDVTGRDLPVRQRYDTPLVHGKDQFRPEQYVLAPDSAKADRSNVASNISSMYHSKGLAPKPARLRVTWIQHFMNADIADELICLAADTSTLRRYEHFRPERDYSAETIRAWFHGSHGGLHSV